MNKTQAATDVFNKYADDYQQRFMDQQNYKELLDFFLVALPTQRASVLDVACGPGNITRYLLDKRPGLRIVGTDLAENMLVLARKNNPEASFCLLDARESTTLNQQFNGILCGFGLPYLSKEEAIQFIHDARSMLLPGGVLYISTMEGEYLQSGWKESSSNPDDKTYTHFHEFEYLNKAFADSGFAVPRVQRKEYVSPNGTTALDLVLVASLPS